MAIDFEQIPDTIRVPGVYIEISNRLAFGGLFRFPERILVIGAMGGRTPGEARPNQPVRVLSGDDAAGKFGRGSMLHGMFVGLKAANRFTETWALPIPAALGDSAVGSVAFAGQQSEAGTLHLYIAGEPVKAPVRIGETGAELATRLATAINSLPDLPVAASIDGADPAQVNIQALQAGAWGNDIDLRLNYFAGERTPSGLTVTVTAAAGGTGDPDISAGLAALGDEQFEHIVMPFTDPLNLERVETLLAERWAPLKQIEGFAYAARAGRLSDLITWGRGRNSQHVSVVGVQNSPTPPWIWAAVYGATVAFAAGIDPARPFQTLDLDGVRASNDPADIFTLEERNLLLYAGVATFTVGVADGRVRIERAVTTYQNNPQGFLDPSYLDANTVLTLAYLRRDLRVYIATRFPRHKLADDGTPVGPGQAIATPRTVRDVIVARYKLWLEAGLAEDIEQFKADLVVERNADDPNRLDALVPANIVNQLRIIAMLIEFRL